MAVKSLPVGNDPRNKQIVLAASDDADARLLPVHLLYTATAIAFAYPTGRNLSSASFPLQLAHATVAAALAPKKSALALPDRDADGKFAETETTDAVHEATSSTTDAVRRNTRALADLGLVERRRKRNEETGAEDGLGTPYLYRFPSRCWAPLHGDEPFDNELDNELRAVWATRPDPHEWALYVRLRCGGSEGEWAELFARTGVAPKTARKWLARSPLLDVEKRAHPDPKRSADWVRVRFFVPAHASLTPTPTDAPTSLPADGELVPGFDDELIGDCDDLDIDAMLAAQFGPSSAPAAAAAPALPSVASERPATRARPQHRPGAPTSQPARPRRQPRGLVEDPMPGVAVSLRITADDDAMTLAGAQGAARDETTGDTGGELANAAASANASGARVSSSSATRSRLARESRERDDDERSRDASRGEARMALFGE